MGSRKGSAKTRRRAEFEAQLGESLANFDSVFAREDARRQRAAQEREDALRAKACESKNRYAFLSDAEEAIANCAAHGTRNLHAYRCPYCKGWHLTSKPRGE